MDVREKLVEILRKPIFPHELVDPIEAVADYLLDSGVTVQEWISVKDRLPSVKKAIDGEEYYKTVAVRVEGCEVEKIAYYDCEENRWYDTDDFPILEKVTHWYQLPEWNLPQPPKGE